MTEKDSTNPLMAFVPIIVVILMVFALVGQNLYYRINARVTCIQHPTWVYFPAHSIVAPSCAPPDKAHR